jgi:hypothetical protein
MGLFLWLFLSFSLGGAVKGVDEGALQARAYRWHMSINQ